MVAIVIERAAIGSTAGARLAVLPDLLPPALVCYIEEARTPFEGAGGESGATRRWLETRLTTWQMVVQRCEEEVAELASALHRCQFAADAAASVRVERALREARIRLRAAQAECASVRRWAHTLDVTDSA
jgi:hypothetical protein